MRLRWTAIFDVALAQNIFWLSVFFGVEILKSHFPLEWPHCMYSREIGRSGMRKHYCFWCSGKESTCQCRRCKRCGFGPWLGRSPAGGHGNTFQYSCLENPMERGGWQATVHGVAKHWTWLSDWAHTWSLLVSARFSFSWHISPWMIPAWALFQVGKTVNFASVISGPPLLDNAAVSWLLTVVWSLSPTLCDPMDCSLPGSSVHGILQARILEWVAISFSRGFSWSNVWTCISCIGRRILYHWATKEAWLLPILSSSSYHSSGSKAEQVPSPWFMWGIAGAFFGGLCLTGGILPWASFGLRCAVVPERDTQSRWDPFHLPSLLHCSSW